MSRLSFPAIALIVAACAEPTRPSWGPGPLLSTATVAAKVEVCPGDDDAYSTIAAALAAVAPGGTIEICPGTYAEMLLIEKAVRLEGSGRGGVTLAPPAGPPDVVIRVFTPDPVVLHRVTIDFPGSAIVAGGRTNLTVDRVTVVHANEPVLAFNDALTSGGRARLVVRASFFEGGAPFVAGDVDALIEHNIVRRTWFSCIQVQGPAPDFGVSDAAAPNADIIANDVDECGPAGGIRARVEDGSMVNILGNTIRNSTRSNSPFGILLGFGAGASTGLIEGNTILDYVQPTAPVSSQIPPAAIAIVAGANPVVRFNDIAGNAHAGLRAAGTATIDARCNWWGAADGPSGNGPGSGDAVLGSGRVVPFAAARVNDQQKDPDRKVCQRQAGDIE